MKKLEFIRISRGARGFTLVETLVAVFWTGVSLPGLLFGHPTNRVATMKAKEEGIATDFLIHYGETIKGMPFNGIATGQPINLLYNGANGAPLIAIPASGWWVAINTAAYQTFHPDLLWLQNRNPKMMVTLTTNSVPVSLTTRTSNFK